MKENLVAVLPNNDVAIVILAGGRSSRMKGKNKTLMKLAGKRLIDYAIQRVTQWGKYVALNVNSDLEVFKGYSLPVITDTVGGYLGPLAGILSAMEWAEEVGCSRVLTVAADTPFFPQTLGPTLDSYSLDYEIVMAATENEFGELERHPTFCIWPVGLKDDLYKDLMKGTRKIVSWSDQFKIKNVKFSRDKLVDPFFNINTKEDLIEAESILRGGRI